MNMSALFAGLLSGIIASMGMGGGTVLLIYLTVFAGVEQLKAQGINLLFFIPIGILSLIIYSLRRQIVWKQAVPFAVFGILGSGVGIVLSNVIEGELLSKVFAVFLCVLGTKGLFTKDKKSS